MKSYTFMLNFGFAESGGLAYIPFKSAQKYASAKIALIDLANFFKEHYNEKYCTKLNLCCLENKEKDSEAKFCSNCSCRLEEEGIDSNSYMEYVMEIGHCNNNMYHEDYVEYSNDLRWQAGALGSHNDMHIVYQAEKVLAAAIGYSPDDRVTIESIFKNRTKSKSNSFSFWE